jgi:hypothetical protein
MGCSDPDDNPAADDHPPAARPSPRRCHPRSDENYLREPAAWTLFRRGEGVRPEAVPRQRPPTDPASNQRLPDGLLEEAELQRPGEGQRSAAGQRVVPRQALRRRAGETTSEASPRATETGLSVVPLSQCIVVAENRQQIVETPLDDRTFPQFPLQWVACPQAGHPSTEQPRAGQSLT